MRESIKRILNSKYSFILLLLAVLIYWFVMGQRHSNHLNNQSVVTVGVVTEITREYAYFKFKNGTKSISSAIGIYTGHNYYTGKPNEHLEPGDKLIVRFSRENPDIFEILNNSKYNISMDSLRYGQNLSLKLDSVHFLDYN